MNSDNSQRLRTTSAPEALVFGKPPEIDFSKAQREGAESGGFLDQLEQMQRKLQENVTKKPDNQIVLDELGPTSFSASAFDDPVARALQEARDLINAKNYRDALLVIARALQQDPQHYEAIYLGALCLTNLNDLESAMRTLLPLRRVHLDNDLSTRVQALKVRIRNNMRLMVLLQNAIMLRSGRIAQAMDTFQRLIALDPEAELYYFMLSGSQMMLNKLDQARQTLEIGKRECVGETPMLSSMYAEIVERAALKHLEAARNMAHRGQPARAREVLRKAPTDAQRSELGRQFDRYLSGMERGSLQHGKASTRKAPANHKELEKFHFYLVGSDIKDAMKQLERQRFSDAEKILAYATTLAPEFPYVSYLYASCIFTRLIQQLNSRRRPSEKEISASLELAYTHAVNGAVDTDIKEANLLVSIVRQAREMRQESGMIEPLMVKFKAIMDSAKRGIRTPDQLNDLHRQISQLRSEIQRTLSQLRSEGGRQQMQDLAEAVDRNLNQLNTMKSDLAEGDTVNELAERFKKHMDAIKKRGGLKPGERTSERRFFETLKTDAQVADGSLSGTNSHAQIQALIEVIDQILGQL